MSHYERDGFLRYLQVGMRTESSMERVENFGQLTTCYVFPDLLHSNINIYAAGNAFQGGNLA